MKGVIFNLFEDFVSESFGEDLYEEILEASDLKTTEVFVGPGLYPDEDLVEMISQAVGRLGISLADALRAFGRFSLPRLVAAHPDFADVNLSAREFLLSVDSVIHVEVKKLFPDASTPGFKYDDQGEQGLVMSYFSERQFCPLVEGFLEGVGDVFKEKIEYSQECCTHDGHPHCDFRVRFPDSNG